MVRQFNEQTTAELNKPECYITKIGYEWRIRIKTPNNIWVTLDITNIGTRNQTVMYAVSLGYSVREDISHKE